MTSTNKSTSSPQDDQSSDLSSADRGRVALVLLIMAALSLFLWLQPRQERELAVPLDKVKDSLPPTEADLAIALEDAQMKTRRMSTEIANLTARNQDLDRRLRKVAPVGISAANFRITAGKRDEGRVPNGTQAEEGAIIVQFALNGVPTALRGERELYLAVHTAEGDPVAELSAETIKIPAAGEDLRIPAVDKKMVQLQKDQRVTLSFRPGNEMKAGTYNVFVYSDAGYLGAAGFRLG